MSMRWFVAGCLVSGAVFPASAQVPDHPFISEVFSDPNGTSDGPVGRILSNLHQEYIELYLPTAAQLGAGLNKDALRLAFYEVEGDEDSAGSGLVNYRIDLPTFDLDPSNGLTAGAIARPTSGVVVLGWVDYVGNPPTALAGTPATRVALINGGITSTTDFTFVAINGAQFGGTTNFPVPAAISMINMPGEATSGIIQNGSGVYLLVNRDAAGYVALTDDDDPVGVHNPSLPTNTVLKTSCLLDAWGPNDSSRFDVLDQPSSDGNNDNFLNLPPGGAYSLLACQLPEDDGSTLTPGVANGYARRFIDIRKTTEDANSGNNDPVTDSLNAYRQARFSGPFYPTPGRVVATTTAPELGLADATEAQFSVLAGTTAHPALLAANAGGNYGITVSASTGASSNPAAAVFGGGTSTGNVSGQTVALPPISIQSPLSATHGASGTASATVTATNTNGGDPAVLAPVQVVTATATVLKPAQGKNAAGQPFQATVFAAVQPIVLGAPLNEFAGTSLAAYVSANLGGAAQETWGHTATVLNPGTDISSGAIMDPLVREFPDPIDYVNPPGPPTRLNLLQTVLQSAEVQSGATTYDEVNNGVALRATRVNFPDTLTFDGSFTPTEELYFADAGGRMPGARSGLWRATTERTFEVALLDTNAKLGSMETGSTDDVGIVVEALEVEAGSPILPGEFVFVSLSGGLQGADIDGLSVIPGATVVANILYLDLDNLHTVLGIRSLEQIWLIDAGGATNEIDFVEAFSLNPANFSVPCPEDCSGDGLRDQADLALLLSCYNAGACCDVDGDLDTDQADLAALLAVYALPCP